MARARERSPVIERPAGLDTPLSQVKTAWRQIEAKHELQIGSQERLRALTLEEAVMFANRAQREAARLTGDYMLPQRWINADDVKILLNATERIREDGSLNVIMRHGAEQPRRELQDVLDRIQGEMTPGDFKATQKRKMMIHENNESDPATIQSLCEAVGIGFIFKYIAAKTGQTLVVRTSEYFRARWVAEIIATVADTPYAYRNPWFNSMDYKDPDDPNSMVTREDLEEATPGGTIAFDREKIDKVGSLVPPPTDGRTVYDEIVHREQTLMDQALAMENCIVIDITHSQQHNAAQQRLGIPIGRLTELGMIFVQGKSQGPQAVD